MAAPKSLELLLGLKKEPGLGTLVVVGLGGIYVEIFKDVAMRFAPLTEQDIEQMLGELQAAPLLDGARGQNPINRAELKRYIALLSEIAVRFPEITELDINPLAIAPDGQTFRVLDARMRLEQN
jgi:acetyltransferase